METTVIKRENSIETENFSQTLVVTEDPFSPDILSHLTKLVADMGQDRNDLLDYITKLEMNQQLMLSEMKRLQKQTAEVVHQNNLYHLSLSGQKCLVCTLSGALKIESPPPFPVPNDSSQISPTQAEPAAAELVHEEQADVILQPKQLPEDLIHGEEDDNPLSDLSSLITSLLRPPS